MRKGLVFWRRLSGIDKTFFILLIVYGTLWATGVAPLGRSLVGLAVVFAGLLALFGLVRRTVKGAIWRLRNRLIAAYVLIAVVPVVLILMLFAAAAYAVIGQMAVYLVNTELKHREDALLRQANGLAQFPVGAPERGMNRFVSVVRNSFPNFEILATGTRELRFPEAAKLTHPPPAWNTRANELILKNEGGEERLYAWAHLNIKGEEVTVLAPVTHKILAALVPGLGDVNFVRTRAVQRSPLLGHPQTSHI